MLSFPTSSFISKQIITRFQHVAAMPALALPQLQFAQQQQGKELIVAPVASKSRGLPVCLQQLVK
jgi:hypothetical protein